MELILIAIVIGILVAIVKIAFQEFTSLYWWIRWNIYGWVRKIIQKIPSIPQVIDWYRVRKYKKERLPELIWKTRQGTRNESDAAIAERLKWAKNVDRADFLKRNKQ